MGHDEPETPDVSAIERERDVAMRKASDAEAALQALRLPLTMERVQRQALAEFAARMVMSAEDRAAERQNG